MAITNKSDMTACCIEAAVLILMAVGTVFVFSAGANINVDYSLSHFYSFTTLKQLIFFPIGVIVMYLVARIDYRRFSFHHNPVCKSLTPWLFIASAVLVIAVLIPWIGVERNYSRRWLDIAPGPIYISFQPSEFAKWSMIFLLAAFADKFADSITEYRRRFVPICLLAGGIIGLIIIEDFGTAVFIAFLTFLMLLAAGAKFWHFLTPLPILAGGFYAAVVTSPTRLNRIKDFLNPDRLPYQGRQSLIAISSGGLWGKGLGKGISKYGHLPEDTTDFIFAIISEELGFVGAAAVILLFAALVVLAILVIRRTEDRFGKLLAYGIVLTIGIQAMINIGVVTVVLPTKGIPLPFISAGGTSMLFCATGAGVLLNIARQNSRDTDRQSQEVDEELISTSYSKNAWKSS